MKIGADPEIFLTDAANGLVSAIGLIGGSKQFPRPLPELGDGFAVQEDNVALEYNIPAAESPEQLVGNVSRIMSFLSDQVSTMGLKFSHESAAFFPKEQLMHPAALEFGCDPDYNAWTNKVNPRPKASDETLRSCGGHVHIGAEMPDIAATMRRCDLFLAVPSVLMDKGQLRKQLYGKAGAFRPKPYGAEYRTLSNFWVFSPELIKWVWTNTQLALDAGHLPVEEDKKIVLDAINNNNVAAAQHLIQKYNIPTVQV